MTQNLASYNRKRYGTNTTPRWLQREKAQEEKRKQERGDRWDRAYNSVLAKIIDQNPNMPLKTAEEKARAWVAKKRAEESAKHDRWVEENKEALTQDLPW